MERVGRKNELDSEFVILHTGDENAKIKIECFFYPEYDYDGEKEPEIDARVKELKKRPGGHGGRRIQAAASATCNF